MEHFAEIESFVMQFLYIFILLLEVFGAMVIIFSSFWAIKFFLKTSRDGRYVRLNLAHHLAFGLELFLGAEILRTVIKRDLVELQVLAAIIALRAILTILIHWEIKKDQEIEE